MGSVTPVHAVTLAAAVYNPQPGDFDWFGGCGFVTLGVKHLPDCDVVVPRGSITALDWFRDLISQVPGTVPGFEALGPVPFGFALKLGEAYHDLVPLLRPGVPLVLPAHSLGGAMAVLLGAMHVVAGGTLAGIFAFEAPRAGGPLLTALLKPYPLVWTINGMDPFPHLPTPPWERQRDPVWLDVPPAGDLAFIPTEWHHLPLVAQGVAALVA